jgi:hypothetical protein
MPASPSVTSTVPTTSRRLAPSARDSGTSPPTDISATMPIGTLMRKQLRQPSPAMSACTSTPPISWPPTAASPSTIP